ncbi:MAG: serine/threonine-protein kinase [Polyangiales bacterium]
MQAGAATQVESERFGPFRTLSVLGVGGMGLVYRAVHEDTGAIVALKTVTKHREFDLVGLRREIHALQKVDHPGVVRILDAGVRDGVPWYAMPLLLGETLSAFARSLRAPRQGMSEVRTTRVDAGSDEVMVPLLESPDSPIEPPLAAFGRLDEILTVARRLAMTLAFLHGEGIVHRDLTPANVFVVDGEHPRLLDFGLFRRFAGDEGRESIDDPFGFSGGTIGYMSPEQSRGDFADARSDLYALGVILYELVTGRLPQSKAILPPGLLVRELPRGIDSMIMKLLAADPAERFGHATELVPILATHGARPASWEREITPRGYLYRPRMVGRSSALAAIDERVAQALERRGGCVLIAGESGIGKTYLAMHAARAAAGYGVEVLASSCGAPGGSETPALHPFRAILQAVADRCVGNPELSPTLLGDYGRVLGTIEPRIATLPWVEKSPGLPVVSAEVGQRRLFSALSSLLEAYARTWPCLLVLDDLQWADELTLRFLAQLPNDWFTGKGLLVVATYRVDEDNAGIRVLEQRPWAFRVELARLGEADVRALVRDMLAMRAPPDPWIAALTRASGGNPFYVAEYLRSAAADGTLSRDPEGRWRFDAELLDSARVSLPAPPRIDAIIGRRLDALGAEARQLLDALVVLEKEAGADLAVALAGLDEEQALDARRELIMRQVVDAQGSSLDVLHDALRETAYRRLDETKRRATHRRAAYLIESRAEGQPGFDLLYASLARHFTLGREPRKAVDYLELAGERARATYANRDALAHFRDALDLADEAGTSKTRRARFRRRSGEASYALGDLRASEEHLSAALSLLGEAQPGTRAWLAALARDLPTQVMHRLSSPTVTREGEENERLVEAARTFDLLAERAYYGLDSTVMVAASIRAVNRAERAGLLLARPYAMLGLTAGLSKLHSLAHRYFKMAHEATESDASALALVHIAEAAFHTGEGSWMRVRPLVERVLDVAEKTRDLRALGLAETLLGHEQFYRGMLRESAETYSRLERRGRRDENQQYVAWGLYAGARARIPLGEHDLARRMLTEADALLEADDDAPSKLICTGLLAAVHLATGDLEQALIATERCEALIRSTPPTVFSTVSGYVAVAEVRLAAARRLGDSASKKRAARAVSDLERFAFAIGIGKPAAARLRAQLLLASGNESAARRKLADAVKHARALHMREEESLAQSALAQLR